MHGRVNYGSAGICNEKGTSRDLLCGRSHHIPAAMVSPIVIFLLINKFEVARNPKF